MGIGSTSAQDRSKVRSRRDAQLQTSHDVLCIHLQRLSHCIHGHLLKLASPEERDTDADALVVFFADHPVCDVSAKDIQTGRPGDDASEIFQVIGADFLTQLGWRSIENLASGPAQGRDWILNTRIVPVAELRMRLVPEKQMLHTFSPACPVVFGSLPHNTTTITYGPFPHTTSSAACTPY